MNKYSLILASVVTLFSTAITFAQGLPPADGDGVPVDGGITALLVGGAIYGAKKLKEKKNQK